MRDQESRAPHQISDLKVTVSDTISLIDTVTHGITFDQPIKVSDQNIRTEPTPMLYQPPFYLSEANFEKIRRPSGKLAGAGWSFIGLAATNASRLLLKFSEMGFSESSIVSSKFEVIATVAIGLFGAILLFISSYLSRTKNSIFKDIQKHFESNKPKLEIRRTEKTT